MAFAVTARHSQGPTTTSGQTAATDSTTATASSLLLVTWASERDSHTQAEAVQTPTGGSLTYTQQAVSTAQPWDGSDGFAILAAMYSAPISGSPGAHTVTVDSFSTTNVAWYSTLCCDITGHNASTPVVQTKTNGGDGAGGNSVSGTVVYDSNLTTGNLVVVAFYAGADGGGGFAAPTIGGQSMTSLFNQNGANNQGCLYYRVITGAESNKTITCTDVGQTVGNWTAVAVEIAAAGGTDATAEPAVIATVVSLPQVASAGEPSTAPSMYVVRSNVRLR